MKKRKRTKVYLKKVYAQPSLRTRRETVGTQGHVAELLQMRLGEQFTRATLTKIESGTYPISDKLALAIAQVLDSTVSELFRSEDE